MPTEDLHAYQLHLKSFTDEYKPEGATESHLVQALADTSWRLNRVAALETNLLTLGMAHATCPVSGAPPQIQDALALVSALESQSKALANLSMHSQRLSRQFERTVAQLRELQETRSAQQKQELNDLIDILNMYDEAGETYSPSEDGFVFSEAQIDAGMRARNRKHLADEAYHRANEAAM
jgi:hypothetical protein